MVCANKLILPFKSGGKALSVTCGDSSPKGRAKQGARSLLKIPGFRTLLHRQEKARGKALRDNLGSPSGRTVTNAARERHLALPPGELAAKPTERAKNERINTDTLR